MLGGEIDDRSEILVGGGEHGENIAIAFGEQLARRAVGFDHGHLMLLDDGQDRLGQARAVRPENVLDAVLLDQPLGELGAARRCRLVVEIMDHELIARAADLDPASIVDLADGEFVSVLGIGAVLRIFAGERHRSAEDDHILACWSHADAAQRANKGSHQACRQPSPRPHCLQPPPPSFSCESCASHRLRRYRRPVQSRAARLATSGGCNSSRPASTRELHPAPPVKADRR